MVVVADDFGLSESTNLGVLKSFQDGIVTELSLMVDAPETGEAIKLITKYNITRVGIHTLLFSFFPLEKGRKMSKEDYVRLFREKTETEIRAIAEKELMLFEKLVGYKPTHICPQWGLHGNLKLLDFIIEYANANNIPVRRPLTALSSSSPDLSDDDNYAANIMLQRANIRTTNYLFGHMTGSDSQIIKNQFLADLKNVREGECAEILFHPSFFDETLLKSSSLNYERTRDVAICIDVDFKKDIESLGFEIVDYSKI